MNAPVQKSEQRPGITVYQLVDPQEERGYLSSTIPTAYPTPPAESSETSPWTAVIALATSLLMLGIAWMVVQYWNLLIG